MRKILTAAFIIFTSVAFANDDTSHYKAETIKDSAHAISILKDANETIFKTLSLPEFSSSEFEELHQLSYNMEAAIDKIEDEALYSETIIDPLEGVIEEIHEASEDYEKNELLEASKEYSTLLDAL